MSTESKHTPGPWWVEVRPNPASAITPLFQIQAKHRGEGSNYCIASVNFWEAPEANARLIAAAPDLLSALKKVHKLLTYAEPHSNEEFYATLDEIEAVLESAISEAEGRNG